MNNKTPNKIKDILERMADCDECMLNDHHMMHLREIENILDESKEDLQSLYDDTKMALNGQWDTSMPEATGAFEASQQVIENIATRLGISLEI